MLVHTWNSARNPDPLLGFSVPGRIVQVAKRHPEARVILGHSGGEYDGILEAISIARSFPHIYLDTASSRLYPGVIEEMVRGVGAEKVLYGSDMPFLNPVTQIAKVVYSNIPVSDKKNILGLNAARLFGIPIEGSLP